MIQSQITFLNFYDFEGAKAFIRNHFQLPLVTDTSVAAIFQVTKTSFLGVVDASRGTIQAPDTHRNSGTMFTFVTEDVEKYHEKLSQEGVKVTPIKVIEAFGIRTFFIDAPEGYTFEVQAFLSPEDIAVYHLRD